MVRGAPCLNAASTRAAAPATVLDAWGGCAVVVRPVGGRGQGAEPDRGPGRSVVDTDISLSYYRHVGYGSRLEEAT